MQLVLEELGVAQPHQDVVDMVSIVDENGDYRVRTPAFVRLFSDVLLGSAGGQASGSES